MRLCRYAQLGRPHERTQILPASSTDRRRGQRSGNLPTVHTSSSLLFRSTFVCTIIPSEQDDDKDENLGSMSASEAKKLKNKQRKQQLREQEKHRLMERKKKEFQRSRNKDDAEEEKVKEDRARRRKLERVAVPHPHLSSRKPLSFLHCSVKTAGRSDALPATVGRLLGELSKRTTSAFRSTTVEVSRHSSPNRMNCINPTVEK